MTFDTLSGLEEHIAGMTQAARACADAAKTYPTVFILLSDEAAWAEVVSMLRRECALDLRISRMCWCGRLPPPEKLCRELKQTGGCAVLTALGELIRTLIYPGKGALVDKLRRLRRTGGPLFVPLLRCEGQFGMLLDPKKPAHVLRLNGDVQPIRATFYRPGLPVEGCMSLMDWIRALEEEQLPQYAHVMAYRPGSLGGSGARVVSSAFMLLNMHLSGLNGFADEYLLEDGQWLAMYRLIVPELPEGRARVEKAFYECARMDAEGLLARDDVRRAAGWIYRLQPAGWGAYWARVIAAYSRYDSLEDAVIMEILNAYQPGQDEAEFSPASMSAPEWLAVRARRGAMLKLLNIERMSAEYWALLERVERRRKLLFSSLTTDDERAYCRNYLLNDFRLTPGQLEQREDLQRLFPELLDEVGAARREMSGEAGGTAATGEDFAGDELDFCTECTGAHWAEGVNWPE